MDKPRPLNYSTNKPNLPSRLTTMTSHTLLQFISCVLLLTVSTSGKRQPHVDQEPDMVRMDKQRVLLLEAVKSGILDSLGMDKEPRPTQKASEDELSKMYQLYREKMREMSGNSTQAMKKTQQSTMWTVLFPVESLKVLQRREHPQSGRRMQWYRAVFQKNLSFQTVLNIAKAELKISRRVSDQLSLVQPVVEQEIKVKVNGMKPVISATWTHSAVNGTEDVILDISSEAKKWMDTDGQSLVVDVGVVVVNRKADKLSPMLSVELGLAQLEPSQKMRPRRSNKEDDCDERGWCCRKSVTVSFKEIGWTDWVVTPTEYTMHFCDGACPHNYKPASMHTQVKSRLHQVTKGGTPHPCCVPASYEPMVIMHYDSRGKLKLTTFNDFIVTKCYCA